MGGNGDRQIMIASLIWSKIKIDSNLKAENIALRQQLAVMQRTVNQTTENSTGRPTFLDSSLPDLERLAGSSD